MGAPRAKPSETTPSDVKAIKEGDAVKEEVCTEDGTAGLDEEAECSGDSDSNEDPEEGAEELAAEFERLPLHDSSPDDEGWVRPRSSRPDDAASVVSSATAEKRRANPPGWCDGEDDDAGWITPDNHAGLVPEGCEGRAEEEDGRVACATTDFAMQNVLLQVGLRVLNMDGLVVKETKRYVLKCHACFKICHDATKLFCPVCGNATLMRVSMYVRADGTIGYTKGIKNFNLRGTKYSLPLPQQGRGKDDLVLREDQLLLSRHRRRPAPKTDPDGFVTFSAAARGKGGPADGQEIIGMGFG